MKSYFWSAVENGGGTVLSLITLFVFIKIIPPSDFGVYAICLAIVEVFGIFATMFFHDALIREVDVAKEDFDILYSLSFVLGAAVFLVALGFFFATSGYFGDERYLVVGAVLSSVCFLNSPASIIQAKCKRDSDYKILAIRGIFGKLLGGVVGVVFALLGYGVWSLILQYVLMNFIGAAFLFLKTDVKLSFSSGLFFHAAKKYFNYGAKSIASLLIGFSTKRLYIPYVGAILGAEASGVLSVAFKLVDTLWSVTAMALSQVVFPIFSRAQNKAENGSDDFGAILSRGALVIFPVYFILGIISDELVANFFRPEWKSVAPLIKILSLLVCFQYPRLVFGLHLTAEKGPGGGLFVSFFAFILILVFVVFCSIGDIVSASFLWFFIEAISALVLLVVYFKLLDKEVTDLMLYLRNLAILLMQAACIDFLFQKLTYGFYWNFAFVVLTYVLAWGALIYFLDKDFFKILSGSFGFGRKT